MNRRKLEEEEIKKALKNLDGWETDGKYIKKRYEFDNFASSLEFVNKVGAIAEDADHHPDIKFGWGFAEISLTTHDRGGVTDFDLAVAGRVDAK